VEFVQAAQEAGIKPIVGVELSVAENPLLLYVESARGYANLCRLLSRHAELAVKQTDEASVADQQRRPYRLDEFAGFTGGLVAVSPDERLADLFGGSFYRMATAGKSGFASRGMSCDSLCRSWRPSEI
jgi:DNA polymerase III alpha subunit